MIWWITITNQLLLCVQIPQYCTILFFHHQNHDDVRSETEQPHLLATVHAWHLSLFGHNVQMSAESDAKQILTASPLENWRRPPGRPHNTWMKTTQEDLKSTNLSQNKEIDMAQNRPLWRLMLALRTHRGACQKWMNEWEPSPAASISL